MRSTTSSIPGTTLGLIPFRLHGKGTTERLGKSIAIRLRRCLLFDTPGLVRFGHLHQFFQGRDQQALVYSSRVHPVTLVLKPDQVVILGTQVLLHHKSSKPFMYSIFVPKSVSVHVANKNRVPELLDKHVGTILFPPFNPESLANCPSYLRQTFRKEFDNGRRAQWEIAFDGLGWVSFTGKGFLEIEIASMTPGVWVRKPIMPNEAFRKTLTALRGNTLGTKPKSLRGKSIEMKQFPASEHLKVREFLDVSPNPISSPQIPS